MKSFPVNTSVALPLLIQGSLGVLPQRNLPEVLILPTEVKTRGDEIVPTPSVSVHEAKRVGGMSPFRGNSGRAKVVSDMCRCDYVGPAELNLQAEEHLGDVAG